MVMVDERLLLYTGVFGDGSKNGYPVVYITDDSKAFLGCPKRCFEPLEIQESDSLELPERTNCFLICPVCEWKTTMRIARETLGSIIGHLVALCATIEKWDPAQGIRAIWEDV